MGGAVEKWRTGGSIALVVAVTLRMVMVPIAQNLVSSHATRVLAPHETSTRIAKAARGRASSPRRTRASVPPEITPGARPHVGGTGTVATWTTSFPSVPSPRLLSSALWDSNHQYYPLFGGVGAAVYNDTWTMGLGKVWNQLTPATHPTPRYEAAMAYDPVDKYAVLFGGTDGMNVFSDTWTFHAGKWTKLSPAAHPPRCGALR